MTNIYQGFGPDEMPTAPHAVPQAGYGGSGASGPGGGSGGSGSGGSRSGGSGSGGGGRRRRWAAVLAVTAVVVGGGAFAAAEAATGSPAAPAALASAGAPAATTARAATSTQATSTQAAVLNSVLSGPGRLGRLRRLGGMYGQFTVETKQGARTLAFERGTIESVAGGHVVVRARNGMTETWTLTSASVVRAAGKRATDSALKSGELVFTGGQVSGSTRDARLIVIRKAASSTAQPTT
jgi:hypothetical protein